MAEIGNTAVLDGVTLALRAAYPERGIFTGSVEIGLSPGDFNVSLIDAGETPGTGPRLRRAPLFEILYYPKGEAETPDEECIAAGDALLSLLGCIRLPTGDLLFGRGMEYRLTDGLLSFTVRYPYFAYRKGPEPPVMDSLVTKQTATEQKGTI